MRKIIALLMLMISFTADASIVGRLQLNHPALGSAGGSTLYTAIEAIYTKISDNMGSRYYTHSAIANSTTVTDIHGLGLTYPADLTVLIYTGTYPTLTRVFDPVAAGWTIAGTSGSTTTSLDITTPSSGGPFTFVVMVLEGQNTTTLDGSTLSKSSSGLKVSTGGITNNEVATGISRAKLSAGTTNRLAYNDGSTGLLVDLAAITGSKALVSNSSGLPIASSVTDTELGYVSGVTSAIQTQFSGKEPTITTLTIAKGGTASGTTLSNNRVMISSGSAIVEASAITGSKALVSNSSGIPIASTVTDTELAFVSGVTSAIQTQFTNTRAVNANVSVSSNVTLTNKALHLVSTAAARSLTLPAASATLFLIVKDSTGGAQSNNITITPPSGTIDGAASYILNGNYSSVTIASDGTNFFVL